MPNIWTHILFSEEVIDAISNPYSQYDDFIKLGAQCPCLFFYYNFWQKDKKPLYKIGKDLYSKHYKDFLTDLIIASKDQCKQVQAFVMGHVTHYVLNQNTFPYICYFADHENSDCERMGIIIDTMLMDKYYNIKTWKNKVYKEIDVGANLHKDILKLLNQTMKKYYPELSIAPPNYIQKAYRDMKLALKLFSDPYGWKSFLLKPFHSYNAHRPVKSKKDYLNLDKNIWYHPITKEPSKKSFVELYNKSRIEGIEFVTEVQNFWQGKHIFSKQTPSEITDPLSFASVME